MDKKKLTAEFIKEEYERMNKEVFSNDYEFNRWLKKRNQWESFRMQYYSLKYHSKGIKFKNYLEIGVGPGTWTKLFLKKDGYYTLIDISQEMLNQLKMNLGERKNFDILCIDFQNYSEKEKFDFVMSSRAIKYIPDKEKVIKNIYRALKKGGNGIIITQSKDTLIQRLKMLFGCKEKLMHSGGITHKNLVFYLKNSGFKNIKTYPVSIGYIRIPGLIVFHSLNWMLWKIFYKKEINWFSKLISGSYMIKFQK